MTPWDRMSEAEKVAKVAEVVMEWQKDFATFWITQENIMVNTDRLLSWPGEGFSLIVEAMRKRGFIYQDFWMREDVVCVEFRTPDPHPLGFVRGGRGLHKDNPTHAAAIAALTALGEGKLFEEEV